MKLFSIFLALPFTSAGIAHGSNEMSKGKPEKSDKKRKHTHNTISIEMECKEIIIFKRLELLTSNTT
jgi:hypothetical protein